MTRANLDFVAAACNSVSNCLDWGYSTETGNSGICAYGAHKNIFICDPMQMKVLSVLYGHSHRVNCVRFLSSSTTKLELFSASTDGTIRVWKMENNSNMQEWTCTAILNPQEGEQKMQQETQEEGENEQKSSPPAIQSDSIVAVSCTRINSFTIIETSSVAGNLVTWIRDDEKNEWTKSGIINFKPNSKADAIEIFVLSAKGIPSLLVLAAGCLDSRIRCFVCSVQYIQETGTVQFKQQLPDLRGHQDWVRTLAVCTNGNRYLMASGGQDFKILLWSIEEKDVVEQKSADNQVNITQDYFDGEIAEDSESEKELDFNDDIDEVYLELHDRQSARFVVSLESRLFGHEEWVTCVRWKPQMSQDSQFVQIPTLLSVSMDRCVFIWQPDNHTKTNSGNLSDHPTGVWSIITQMGDLGATVGGSIGGNILGYLGATFDPSGSHILVYAYGGSFHLWEAKHAINDLNQIDWISLPSFTGHFNAANDVVWDPFGRFVVSVSDDQTCRVFSELYTASNNRIWHEVSRPQVHGYDLKCCSIIASPDKLDLNSETKETEEKVLQLITGPDEKVLRVFEVTQIVLNCLHSLNPNIFEKRKTKLFAAYMPELTLSNKVVKSLDDCSIDERADQTGGAGGDIEAVKKALQGVEWKSAPLEGDLIDHTRWPETQKLYGHGNEIVALDIDRTGSFMASSCKARDISTARILVWDTKQWKLIGSLESHESTVVQIRISPDSTLIASVSKDRSISLFGRNEENSFSLFTKVMKAHKRIIWSCSWSPDSEIIVTGARDKEIKFWKVNKNETDGNLKLLHTVKLNESVTAVDFLPQITKDQQYILAVGLETGDISLFTIPIQSITSCSLLYSFPKSICHSDVVKRLAWKPFSSDLFLASCSDDCSVRIFSINI